MERGYVGISPEKLKAGMRMIGCFQQPDPLGRTKRLKGGRAVRHIDQRYLSVAKDLIQKQLEVIAAASKGDTSAESEDEPLPDISPS